MSGHTTNTMPTLARALRIARAYVRDHPDVAARGGVDIYERTDGVGGYVAIPGPPPDGGDRYPPAGRMVGHIEANGTLRRQPGVRVRAPGAGRPSNGDEPMQRRTVTLPPDTIRRLERLGDGNLSAGIRAVVAEHSQPD